MRKIFSKGCVLVGLAAGAISMAHAQTPDYVVFAGGQSPSSFAQMMDALAQADVVFLGENHDHGGGHALQTAIVRTLLQRNVPVALGMEMFERDVQGVLDEYLGGQISESSFLQAARPWPNYKEHYRPTVELLHEKNLPVIGTNAPRRYVSIVGRKGQEALRELPTASRSYLAPLPYFMTLPSGYEQQLDEIFGLPHTAQPQGEKGRQGEGETRKQETGNKEQTPTPNAQRLTPSNPIPNPQSSIPNPSNMKAAQGLWDATMADSLVQFVRKDKGRHLVIHLNGSMHSDHRYGIVDRLQKALPALKIRTVTVRPDAAFPHMKTAEYADLADFVIVTPPDPKVPPTAAAK